MIDLKKAKLEDFEIIKARPRDPKKKVVCTYYRIKPDGFFNGHIQTGVHSIS
jgi:hypothetical protein